jgi:hypothetical protein
MFPLIHQRKTFSFKNPFCFSKIFAFFCLLRLWKSAGYVDLINQLAGVFPKAHPHLVSFFVKLHPSKGENKEFNSSKSDSSPKVLPSSEIYIPIFPHQSKDLYSKNISIPAHWTYKSRKNPIRGLSPLTKYLPQISYSPHSIVLPGEQSHHRCFFILAK